MMRLYSALLVVAVAFDEDAVSLLQVSVKKHNLNATAGCGPIPIHCPEEGKVKTDDCPVGCDHIKSCEQFEAAAAFWDRKFSTSPWPTGHKRPTGCFRNRKWNVKCNDKGPFGPMRGKWPVCALIEGHPRWKGTEYEAKPCPPSTTTTTTTTTSHWYCVARKNKGVVEGPFLSAEGARNVLNQQGGNSGNQQMVCEMSSAGASADPHTVGGLNQGGGTGAGFNKWWGNWPDIHQMNDMCNKHAPCKNNEATWFCVARKNRGAVEGPFATAEEARNVLNQQGGNSGNQQMVCEMASTGALADPHTVGGLNQGGGTGAGFNKWWGNWPDIRHMNDMCNNHAYCRNNEVTTTTTTTTSHWYCVARKNRGSVEGPFQTAEQAKNVLNQQAGNSGNQQMVCEMGASGANSDPHTVGGLNQGGGTGAGFNKWWGNWPDIHQMTAMCNNNGPCRNNKPEVKPSTWWCVARKNRGQVQGPYKNFNDAKTVLNQQGGNSGNQQMICEMTNAGAKSDPHQVNGQNQGGGRGAGFNKWWGGWGEINHMNNMCNGNSNCRNYNTR